MKHLKKATFIVVFVLAVAISLRRIWGGAFGWEGSTSGEWAFITLFGVIAIAVLAFIFTKKEK